MSERTTKNGHEITSPTETLDAVGFKDLIAGEYGIDGADPKERAEQLKHLPPEQVALMLVDVNKLVEGSAEPLTRHDDAMKIGETSTIVPEHRYDVFMSLMRGIRDVPETTNPARIGDTLALGVVLLHPFHDGNGRTARLLGLLFRDRYDGAPDEYERDFAALAEPRDDARARGGGFMIYGYTPHFAEGEDQSDPTTVSRYLKKLLTEEAAPYIGPYGPAPLT